MKKFLLVALTTSRTVDGAKKRVRFPAKTTQDLTKAELEELDALTMTTGKLHYRDSVNEDGGAAASDSDDGDDGDDGDTELFAGETVDMADKTAAHLKAYLTHNEVEFDNKANKAALLELATDHAAEADDNDPDGGL